MTASSNVVELMYVSYQKRLDRAELHSQGIIITIKVVNVRNLRGADVEEMRIISRRYQNVNMNVIIMENAVLPILVNRNISKAAPRKVIRNNVRKNKIKKVEITFVNGSVVVMLDIVNGMELMEKKEVQKRNVLLNCLKENVRVTIIVSGSLDIQHQNIWKI